METSTSNEKYRIHLKGFEAVILYPALVTPSIVAKKSGCMTIVLATKEDFYNDVYLKDKQEDGTIGALTARKFHSQLSFVLFGGTEIFDLTEFAYKGNQRNLTAEKNMIYKDHNAAMAHHHKDCQDYRGWYLGALNEVDPVKGYDIKPIEGYDADGEKKLLGILSPWAVNMYAKRKYTRLFQLNFKNFDKVGTPGMYEVAFTFYKKFDDNDLAGEHTMNDKDITDKEISRGSGKKFCYTDPDDDVLKDYLKNHIVGWEPEFVSTIPDVITIGSRDRRDPKEVAQKQRQEREDHSKKAASRQVINTMPKIIRKPSTVDVDKTVGDMDMFSMYSASSRNDVVCGYPDCTVCKEKGKDGKTKIKEGNKHEMFFLNSESGEWGNRFIQTRHPVYIPESWTAKLGVLGDLHISSRQAVYKLVRSQVILGADVADSPIIGEHAHENLQSVQWLMNEMGERKCDLLAIVGDIFDHVTNLDPAYCIDMLRKAEEANKEVKDGNTTNGLDARKLWDLLSKQKHLDNFDIYPQYIDLMQFLALVVNYYTVHKRPIVAVNGNHEAYSIPYGISPYIGTKNYEAIACNAGIPCDHNLPRYDATLLYGPGFGDLGASIKEGLNFKAKCFDAFYCLLTPWSDFALAYEGQQQENGERTGRQDFLTFGWGNTEAYIRPFLGGAGTLPRADSNFHERQIELLEDWTSHKKGDVMVLTHFPFASYDTALPLDANGAWVNAYTPSKYDWGSFNSPAGYRAVSEGASDEASEKASNKAPDEAPQGASPEKIDYTLSGHTHRPAIYTPRWSNKESFKSTARYKDPGKNYTILTKQDKFLVCGSAGPYSKQNYHGELKGLGQLRPQGMILEIKPNQNPPRTYYGPPLPHVAAVEWVEDTTAPLPRFAAVVDSMRAFEGVSPFVDCGKTNGEVFRRGINDCANKFYFFLNPEFIKSINLLYPKKDSEEVIVGASLHCVITKEKEVVKVAMTMKKSGKTQRGNPRGPHDTRLHYFEAIDEDLVKFQKKCMAAAAKNNASVKGEDTISDGNAYFMSVKFGGPSEIAQHYDLSYPWCFPVIVTDIDGGDDDIFEQPFGIIKRDISYLGGSVANHRTYEDLNLV